MRTRQAIHNPTMVLAAVALVPLIIAITLLSPSAAQAKPLPHGPDRASVPSSAVGTRSHHANNSAATAYGSLR
jgi:hypothetical protein